MDLGFGFVKGLNTVSKQKILYWKHTDKDITWYAFVWYITDYADVENYGTDWVNVKIWSPKQREFFYKKACEYEEGLWKPNYEIDKTDELWKTHKRGARNNYDILLRLCNEG